MRARILCFLNCQTSSEVLLPRIWIGDSLRRMLGDGFRKVHERWLHTIGNLTLTGYNQSLGNRSFEDKKKELCGSKLSLNEIFAKTDSWDEQQITDRAAKLCSQVSQLWPRPSSEIKYTPPAKSAERVNKGRERRTQYWSSFGTILESSGVSLRPTRRCEGRICDFFLPMADVNLSTRLLPNKKQLILRLQFARARGREIYAGLEADREAIDEQFSTLPLWETGSKPTVTLVLQDVLIRDRYDWLEHHNWLVRCLTEFEKGMMGRIRSLHEAVKEKSPPRQLMLEYWIGFHARMFDRGCGLLAITPLPQPWNDLAIGKSGVWMQVYIKPKESEMSACLIMDRTLSPVLYPQLKKIKPEIENDFGQKLDWQTEGLKQWRIGLTRSDVPFDDRSDWPQQHDWLIDQVENLNRVFRNRVQEFDIDSVSGGGT